MQLGTCRERGCDGRLMVVEDMGAWTWAQCEFCLVQDGIGKSSQTVTRGDARHKAPDGAGGDEKGEGWRF